MIVINLKEVVYILLKMKLYSVCWLLIVFKLVKSNPAISGSNENSVIIILNRGVKSDEFLIIFRYLIALENIPRCFLMPSVYKNIRQRLRDII